MATKGLTKLLAEFDDYFDFADEVQEHQTYPSSILGLNYALNNMQGIPGGTIMQIVGDTGTGKTTLALDFLANAQKRGIKELEITNGKKGVRTINAAFIDFERTFDANYASLIGVDVSKVLLITSKWGEQAFALLEALLDEGLQFAIVDSIPMFIPQSEEDKSVTENEKMASRAGVLSRVLPRLINLVAEADALVIILNQFRAELNQMTRRTKKPFGARVMQYISKLTLELARIENKDGKMQIKAIVEKSKINSVAGRSVEYQIVHTQGINVNQHILELALQFGIVDKAGAWYYYPDRVAPTVRAQGEDKALETMPFDEIKEKVMKVLI